ncbi:hypothetical protein AMTRI_Chr10g8070 [Amborella trichopoda]
MGFYGDVAKGHFPIYLGEKHTRFVQKKHLDLTMGITIPCEEMVLDYEDQNLKCCAFQLSMEKPDSFFLYIIVYSDKGEITIKLSVQQII